VKIYSWRDIEFKICGKPTVDVAELKKISVYGV
jgi:hypothetical protein